MSMILISGKGLFTAVASYFNSDCNPNTMRVNVGSTMLLIACRDIKKGDEISDNYCIHFSEMGVNNRTGWLQENYKFKCRCRACEEEWPTFDQLPGQLPTGEVNCGILEQGKSELIKKDVGELLSTGANLFTSKDQGEVHWINKKCFWDRNLGPKAMRCSFVGVIRLGIFTTFIKQTNKQKLNITCSGCLFCKYSDKV